MSAIMQSLAGRERESPSQEAETTEISDGLVRPSRFAMGTRQQAIVREFSAVNGAVYEGRSLFRRVRMPGLDILHAE